MPGPGAVPRLSSRAVGAGDHPADPDWQAEQRAFAGRDLSQVDYVYVWADGIHLNIRLEEHKLCVLVMIGVRADGRKELIALADGSGSPPSRGRTCCATARAAGCAPRCWPSATARWGSGRRCARSSPKARERRCWFHKTANVLDALPKSAQPGAKNALAEIWGAEDKRARPGRGQSVRGRLRRQVPQGRREDHRRRARSCWRSTTTLPSTGSTCGPPIRSSRRSPPSGCAPRSPRVPARAAAGLAMAFKLIESAQDRWRAVNAPHLVALVRAGTTFINGKRRSTSFSAHSRGTPPGRPEEMAHRHRLRDHQHGRPPGCPAQLAAWISGHWQIELLHHIRDVSYGKMPPRSARATSPKSWLPCATSASGS